MHKALMDGGREQYATSVARLSEACEELDQAEEIPDIKGIRDKADAVRQYAQAANLGLDVQNKAAELKLLAERKAGRLLQSLKLRGGDRKSASYTKRMTLQDFGITQNQSKRWQREAAIPDEVFEVYIEQARRNGKEITASGLLRAAKSNGGEPPRKPSGATFSPGPATEPSDEAFILRELINHHQMLTKLIEPIIEETRELRIAERKMLARLTREIAKLLSSPTPWSDSAEGS